MSGARPGLILRNSILNVLTQGSLLVLAFWAIPILTEGLGRTDFGIMTLLWALVGYFSLLDLGTSRAVTKSVSHALGVGDQSRAKSAMWAGLSFSAVVGIVTCLSLIAAIPLIVHAFGELDQEKASSISDAFLVGSLGIPWILVYGSVTGVFMAHQRFGVINAYRAVTGVIQWVGSAVLIWFGYGFVEIIMLTAAARILVTAFALVHLRRAVPEYFRGVKIWDTSQLRELLSFGGWVTVSQVISPLFLYADRFLIGSLISLSAVALYALPQEALVRLIIIPMSLTTTLFPALSQETTKDDGGSGWAFLYSASLRHLFHVILPLTVILMAFAREILYLWVGPEYAEGSTIMFQIITCGFLFNAMAQIPMAGLQAIGRPELPARFHVMEFLVSITLNVLLIPVFGVTVVAVIWSVRAAIDALLLGAAVHRLQKPVNGMSTLFIEMVGAAVIVAGLLSVETLSVRLVVALGAVAVYLFAIWRYSFGDRERNVLKSIAGFRHFKAL